ncbi:hypothetical protein A4G86_04450 [Burkholderia pseudomallei]|nr:hypothetical protein A4G86_04450 [Burkholderia pseudomallei]
MPLRQKRRQTCERGRDGVDIRQGSHIFGFFAMRGCVAARRARAVEDALGGGARRDEVAASR